MVHLTLHVFPLLCFFTCKLLSWSFHRGACKCIEVLKSSAPRSILDRHQHFCSMWSTTILTQFILRSLADLHLCPVLSAGIAHLSLLSLDSLIEGDWLKKAKPLNRGDFVEVVLKLQITASGDPDRFHWWNPETACTNIEHVDNREDECCHTVVTLCLGLVLSHHFLFNSSMLHILLSFQISPSSCGTCAWLPCVFK